MEAPQKLKFGPKTLISWGTSVVDHILKRTPIQGKGIKVTEEPGGLMISLAEDDIDGTSGTTSTFTINHLGALGYQDVYVKGPVRSTPEPE